MTCHVDKPADLAELVDLALLLGQAVDGVLHDGRAVAVLPDVKVLEGIAHGLDDPGGVLIAREDGRTVRLHAGRWSG